MRPLSDTISLMAASLDRRARFEYLADAVFEPLQRYLRRRLPAADAEDAFSDVLMTLWRRLDDVPTDALPWCYGVARMTVANHRRARRRHLRLVERLIQDPPRQMIEEPAQTAIDPELEEALTQLRPSDREMLRLWAWEDLEPREIANVLGLTVNAATLRLSRARKKLAEALQRQSGAHPGHKRGDGHIGVRDE